MTRVASTRKSGHPQLAVTVRTRPTPASRHAPLPEQPGQHRRCRCYLPRPGTKAVVIGTGLGLATARVLLAHFGKVAVLEPVVTACKGMLSTHARGSGQGERTVGERTVGCAEGRMECRGRGLHGLAARHQQEQLSGPPWNQTSWRPTNAAAALLSCIGGGYQLVFHQRTRVIHIMQPVSALFSWPC